MEKMSEQLLRENASLCKLISELAGRAPPEMSAATDLNLRNIELKALLAQIHEELKELEEPVKSPKEKGIEYIRHLMSIEPDEKDNRATFLWAYESGLLDGHEGRLAALLNGKILGATFGSEQAFFAHKPPDEENMYTLITVPGGQMPTISSSHRQQIKVDNCFDPTHFSELKVPVQFLSNGEAIEQV
jgi:hypothetical protein